MSTKQPKTTSSHQKKAQNRTDRLEEKGEDANMLTTVQAPGARGILEAIAALKNDFGSKFDGVLTALNEIKSDFKPGKTWKTGAVVQILDW